MAETKEWTLMFYFASDNALAPSIVSQLKALKNAGFHPEANVVARFDPHTVGTPLHTFDVNLVPKVEARARLEFLGKGLDASGGHQVGFPPNDPFIRNLVLDKLWGEATIPNGAKAKVKIKDRIRERVEYNVQEFIKYHREHSGLSEDQIKDIDVKSLIQYNPPDPNASDSPGKVKHGKSPEDAAKNGKPADASEDKIDPKQSLNKFLQFCATKYPARHYMLFILGHGLAVGNDMFLFDEHAKKPSLKLKELGAAVGSFNKATKGKLEMIGFHSCSMSSIEVAYELQGKARYMLASQGPEFVGSWPYTQILVRIFNDLIKGAKDIECAVTKIFYYCFYNSYDFQLAGYSFDLALCDLDRVPGMKSHLNALTSELMAALGDKEKGDKGDEFIKGLILLAHWDAQSFWRDTYTDLYDFCLCLYRRCEAAFKYVSGETQGRLVSIRTACVELMKALIGDDEGERKWGLILSSGFAGPDYQYSHGLSVFFPWSQPGNDDFWLKEYPKYKFGKQTNWDEFLQRYFDNTMREPRRNEPGHDNAEHLPVSLDKRTGGISKSYSRGKAYEKSDMGEDSDLPAALLEGITAHIFSGAEPGQLGKAGGSDATGKGGGGDATGKGGGSDASGDDCDCPPIKNYPSFTRGIRGKPTCTSSPKKVKP